ncbi:MULTISPECIES: BON domain-containing protein [Sedimenticola]|uniref:BON domain-containing protein n=1 Tax=Sedimenticola TaxID=349742 RepID=UPI00048FF704|nr:MULTISPECIES: BON domain-containing protein [Sedimenticola]MCW8905095.1 BON domain-containing protein [Sedimenticola sp.]
MSRSKTLLLGLSGFVLILALAFYNGTEKIEQDLKLRGETALAENKLQWVNLEVDGRNLRLQGEAPSNKTADQALHLLEALEGVNRVIDEFTILAGNDGTTTLPVDAAAWSSSIKER